MVMAALWWTPTGARRGRGFAIAVRASRSAARSIRWGTRWPPTTWAAPRQAWDYFQQTQRALNAFSEQPDLATRFAHTAATIESVVPELVSPHADLRRARRGPGQRIQDGAAARRARCCLWLRAEWHRESPGLLRVLIACGVSFVAIAMLFGTRLSGHHFMVLLPLAYGALALGLVALARTPRVGRTATAIVALPFAVLVALNVGGQVKEALRLQEVRGAGLYSDAINRLAADLSTRERQAVRLLSGLGPVDARRVPHRRPRRHGLAREPRRPRGTCCARSATSWSRSSTGDRARAHRGVARALRWDAPSA